MSVSAMMDRGAKIVSPMIGGYFMRDRSTSRSAEPGSDIGVGGAAALFALYSSLALVSSFTQNALGHRKRMSHVLQDTSFKAKVQ